MSLNVHQTLHVPPDMANSLSLGQLNNVQWNPLLRLLTDPRWRIPRHLILIILFVVTGNENGQVSSKQIVDSLIVTLFFLAFAYFNMYWLVPRLLFRNRYFSYVLGFVATLCISFIALYLLDHHLIPKKPGEKYVQFNYHDIMGCMVIFGIIMASSSGIKLFQKYIIDSRRINELEKDRLQFELNQLKSQINPHFLFNTLNNVHVLTQRDPNKAAAILLKLSDLLRFQLYDSSQDKILLTSDISFLDNFLNLEKIRRDHFHFSITLEGNPSGIFIPPFLFIPFVENAIKHNGDSFHESFVHIVFRIEKHLLFFSCENSKPVLTRPSRPVKGGLGLMNIRRRLELCYPNRHTLDIYEHAHRYFANLTIPL